MQGYVRALIQNAKDINLKLLKETDILEFLRNDPRLCGILKAKIDTDLQYVKSHHKEYLMR